MIKFTVPVRTVNPLNGAQGRTRGAVFAKAARRKKERNAARLCLMAAFAAARQHGKTVYTVCNELIVITRVSAGTLDGDGLQAALKSVRDGIADALGINDGDNALTWCYSQRKGPRGAGSVEVEIT